MVPNNKNTHFVPYGIPQYSSSELFRSQIIKQNPFLHNIAIIPLMNIDYDNMYSQILPQISNNPSIKSIEETHTIRSNGKWFLITTKKLKQQAQTDIDSLIEQEEISMNNDTPPGRTTKQHNHKDFISYANMLKDNSQTYDDKLTGIPPSANKRSFQFHTNSYQTKIFR